MSGLVLPTIKKECKILLVTLTWTPEKFRFVATFETIATKDTMKADSISKVDMEAYLGSCSLGDFHFFQSKFSVIGYSNGNIYKVSIDPGPLKFLVNFIGVVFDQVLMPSKIVCMVSIFDRLRVNVLEECFALFAKSVYCAIEELHAKTGFAHMDLRTPNICYRYIKEEMEAVLMDLDSVTDEPQPGDNSVMYNVKFPEAKMYDWRQYCSHNE